jgi:hypothetical protein
LFTEEVTKFEREQKAKAAKRKLGATSLAPQSPNDSNDEPLILNLRGIKTSTDVAEQYIDNLFESLLATE